MSIHRWINAHPYRLLGWILVSWAALVLLLGVTAARADTLNVSWSAPTERVDGTQLPASEIAGYLLDWTVRGNAQATLTLGAVTSYTLDTGTLTGRTCVTLRTVDTDGLTSDPSETVCRNAKPNAPSSLRIGR